MGFGAECTLSSHFHFHVSLYEPGQCFKGKDSWNVMYETLVLQDTDRKCEVILCNYAFIHIFTQKILFTAILKFHKEPVIKMQRKVHIISKNICSIFSGGELIIWGIFQIKLFKRKQSLEISMIRKLMEHDLYGGYQTAAML